MPQLFRFGVVTSGFAQSQSAWVALARRAEELGYATLLMPDRPSMGGLAPITALAFAAGATSTLRVGSYVFCNDYRHPVVLAKEAATLDILSGGRMELGLGAGVSPTDYTQMGLPFDSAGTRISRLEEALQIIKSCFTQEVVNFSGKHYRIANLKGLPRPIQQPHPPIFIGSSGKRLLSIAAQLADGIAPTLRITSQGVDSTDVSLEEKVGWVQSAAGERFAHLELSQSAYFITITDSSAPTILPPGAPPLPRQPMSIEQAASFFIEQRERYGFSYIQVFDGQMENFAPVVARLAGK